MVTQLLNCLTGLPELQLIPVDPLFMTKVTIQDGAGRPVNINLELNNVKNSGFSESDIEAARWVACSITTIPRIYVTEIWVKRMRLSFHSPLQSSSNKTKGIVILSILKHRNQISHASCSSVCPQVIASRWPYGFMLYLVYYNTIVWVFLFVKK